MKIGFKIKKNQWGKIKKKSITFLTAQYLYGLNIIIGFYEKTLHFNFMERQFSFYDTELPKLSMSGKTN
jgi:hypothetical protein